MILRLSRGGQASPQLLPPFGRLLRFLPILVELDDSLSGLVHNQPALPRNGSFPLDDPLIAGQQQRLSLAIFSLTRQAGVQHAFAAVSLPAAGALVLLTAQGLSKQRLRFGIFPLLEPDLAQ